MALDNNYVFNVGGTSNFYYFFDKLTNIYFQDFTDKPLCQKKYFETLLPFTLTIKTDLFI